MKFVSIFLTVFNAINFFNVNCCDQFTVFILQPFWCVIWSLILFRGKHKNDPNANYGKFEGYGGYFIDKSLGSQPKETTKQPTSIKRIRQPISHLIETKKYQQIFSKYSSRDIVILQCCGVPGSGKSQTVRRLAQYFPFKNASDEKNKLIIKWHVQCKDSDHFVKQELQNLAEELYRNGYIPCQANYQSLADAINSGSTIQLVETLVNWKQDVIILVEDPVESSCLSLLKDLFRNIEMIFEKKNYRCTSFHLYITSRSRLSILQKHEEEQMKCYEIEIIKGFEVKEAIDYLSYGINNKDEAAAKKVYKRFSGLPFGLQTAKRYCQDARIGYSEYLDLLEEMNDEITILEKDVVNEYGKSAPHIFQAIVTPFAPTDQNDRENVLHYKILLSLSFFNYDRIPEFVFEYCFQFYRETQVKQIMNKVDVGRLITKLMDHHMCTVTDENEVTFHEVILNSFRLSQYSVLQPQFKPLKMAVEVMAGLVSKDMRKNDQSQKMLKMRRHLKALLGHVEKSEDLFNDSNDKLMLKALVSHLYETTAAVMLNESPALFWNETDLYYNKALNLIWDDGGKLTCGNNNQSPDKQAKSVIKTSKDKGVELPEKFIVDYVSKLNISIDKKEFVFLKSKSKSPVSFEKFEKNFKKNLPNKVLIENLQDCGLFLSNKDYRPIFYAERVASILHSWSRRVLYADSDIAQKDDRSRWMTWLSNAICLECKNNSNVSLLMERLSQTGGLIPIVMKQKKKDSDDYIRVLEFCTQDLSTKQDSAEMYENGLRKEVYGPSHNSTCITLLRSIVRVNARLIGSSDLSFDKSRADKQCKELLELAKSHHGEISNCVMCMIYCAKYYAASRNVKMCMICFDEFFKLNSIRFNIRCWGVYNYMRAVSCFDVPNERRNDAINKGKEVLSSKTKINLDLHHHLNETLKKLQS